MIRKIVTILMSLIMIASFIVLIVEIAPVIESSNIIYVDDVPGEGAGNPAENFTEIQDAINASKNGDTIYIYNGTYYEHLIINKSINLTGENREKTIINGSGSGDIVRVLANWTNIRNITFTNSGPVDFEAAIVLNEAHNCTIINVTTLNNNHGIYLYLSSNNTIIGNNITSNSRYGINFLLSFKNNIISNKITDSSQGIHFYDSCNDNLILNNTITDMGKGLIMSESHNNIISNNIISWGTSHGINFGGPSSYNLFSNNEVIHNDGYGISGGGTKNIIINNNISSNTFRGVYIYGISSNGVIIANNNISNNQYCVYIDTSAYNNTIYHNNFINNANGAYDNVGKNHWNSSYPLGGNYWSNYSGEDHFKGPNQDIPGSDGIGDTPYWRDNYPLMQPYNFKPLENYTILKSGWNLISMPLIQDNQEIIKALEMIDGWYDAVQWHDITNIEDPWKHYKVGKPFGNDLSHLNETKGFWVHITNPSDTIFLYNGTQPTSNQSITLHPGWNLVGYPSLSNRTRGNALNNLNYGNDVDSIWTFNAATQTWQEIGPTDYFELGRGYWIHSKITKVWDVPL